MYNALQGLAKGKDSGWIFFRAFSGYGWRRDHVRLVDIIDDWYNCWSEYILKISNLNQCIQGDHSWWDNSGGGRSREVKNNEENYFFSKFISSHWYWYDIAGQLLDCLWKTREHWGVWLGNPQPFLLKLTSMYVQLSLFQRKKQTGVPGKAQLGSKKVNNVWLNAVWGF